ncbi:dTDP-4-dehydrorhamnose reductase [Roseovarius spongiae]|uniref:dTDP-4-dehydrorhamnose reductase n=1 Tax=Roseovarius spongiae TaxID=2320272 RepID=A0A3A8AVR7_9RHOB|nr:dTDP-4-dehydrorhamnose reductase [Roseovarius spongiae]RKF13472.1 dTDP-4-dehydrorhamnose reductase [Roseovarius spongiae]
MRVVIFGRTGQVARELARAIPDAAFIGRDEADFTDPLACLAALKRHAPEAVINAAAYTAVDRAEEEEPLALQVNARTPGVLAAECAAGGVPFVQISTDYVFDGAGDTAWLPHSPTAPLSAYGRTKLAGEEAVRGAGGPHAILRTSWVFSAHGANFVKSMLRLGAERDALRIVADQVGGPTPADAIAQACLTLARNLRDGAPGGAYHFAGAPDVSWAGFAREIFAQAGMQTEVSDIPTSEYPTPAKRPSNSRLDCTSLMRDHGIARPDWRAGLARVLQELNVT